MVIRFDFYSKKLHICRANLRIFFQSDLYCLMSSELYLGGFFVFFFATSHPQTRENYYFKFLSDLFSAIHVTGMMQAKSHNLKYKATNTSTFQSFN